MRKVGPAVALLATTAVALTAHAPSAVHAARSNPGGRGSRDNQIHFIPAIPSVFPDDKLDEDVAKVQSMDEATLKQELRTLYSDSQLTIQERLSFPRGSLEAMQRILRAPESKDQDQRELNKVMNRYALLVGRMTRTYAKIFGLKVELRFSLTPQEYKEMVAKLQPLEDSWSKDCRVLIAYLRQAAGELRAKSATQERLRGALGFITELAAVYGARQTLFNMDLTRVRMRFKPEKPVDLEVLEKDRAYREAGNQFSAALAACRRRSSQARALAATSVKSGILSRDYLTLLPFDATRK
ncbi:hypothetical protein Emag_006545 [Eimeria magna]